MVNGSKERTSWAEGETVLMPPLAMTAEYPLTDGSPSGISYHDTVLFVSINSTQSKVIAINTQTGDELWSFNDSIVLCGGQHGLGLHALDRFTGTEKWFRGIGGLFARHPVIDSNRVYIVADSLYCLDINDGSTIWSVAFSAKVYPAVDGENVYICGGNRLVAFNKLNGDTIWQVENSQYWYSSIAIDDNYLYTYNNDSIQARDKEDCSLKWFYKLPDRTFSYGATSALAITDSFLCVSVWENPDKKGELYTLDKATGEYRWHHTFDTIGVFSPTIANGIVYTVKWGTYSLWGFDIKTGETAFFEGSRNYYNQPIIVSGKLFVGSTRKIVTFENYGTGIEPAGVGNNMSPGQLKTWPNPFDQWTSFQFNLDQPDYINISVYDLSGKRVKTISERKFESGIHTLSWDGTNDRNQKAPPGIYILRLMNKNYIKSNSMILLK
jgi:outer membrane protein assembly factor BamB